MIEIGRDDNTNDKFPILSGSCVSEIAKHASEKLAINPEECVIFEMKSTGEKVIFKESNTCVITTLGHNGR